MDSYPARFWRASHSWRGPVRSWTNSLSAAIERTLPRSHGRIDDIEVLRAVAVLFTLFGHLSELIHFRYPATVWMATSMWGGVDLFFCISGFVIARTIIHTVPEEKSLKSFFYFAVPFWIRRIFRIWPAAYFWIAVSLICAYFYNKTGAFGPIKNDVQSALGAILQIQNFHHLECNYYKQGACYNLFGIFWSLSLEEQFYILFPILLFFVRRRWVIYFFVVCIVGQFFLERPTWSPGWAIRCDALMLGALIAYAQTHPDLKIIEPTFLKNKFASYFLFAFVCLLMAMAVSDSSIVTLSPTDKSVVWFSTGILAWLCALMVFNASFAQSYTLPPSLFRTILMYIGTRSYALYLAHNCVYFFVRESFNRFSPETLATGHSVVGLMSIALPASFIFAELTYRYIETPLRLKGREKAAAFRAQADTTRTKGAA